MASIDSVSGGPNYDKIADIVAKLGAAKSEQVAGLEKSLRSELNKNVKDVDAGRAVVKALKKPTDAEVLKTFVNKNPAYREYFTDAFNIVAPNKLVNQTKAKERKAPTPGGNERISAGRRNADAASVQANLDARIAKTDETKTGATAEGGTVRSIKDKPVKRKKISTAKASDGAGINPGTSVSDAKADGTLPAPDEIFTRVLDRLAATADGKGNDLYLQLEAKRDSLLRDKHQLAAAQASLVELKKLAEKEPGKHNDQIREVQGFIASLGNLKTEEANLNKSFEKLKGLPNTAAFVQQYFGLLTGAPLDNESTEGKLANAILLHIRGADTGDALTTEQKQKIDAFLADPKNSKLANLQDVFAQMERIGQQVATSPNATNLFSRMLGFLGHYAASGERIDDATADKFTRSLIGADANGPREAAAARQGVNPDGSPKNADNKNAELRDASAILPKKEVERSDPEDKRAYDPKDPSWFGLSKARRRELEERGQHELIRAIDEYHSEVRSFHLASATRLSAMQSLLHSGLPIESIILLFMALMTEHEEQKLKLKMREVTVAEQFDRANRKVESDQKWARDVLNKYRAGQITDKDFEKGDLAKFQAMAGEIKDEDGISKEQAESTRKLAWEKLGTLYGEFPQGDEKLPDGLNIEDMKAASAKMSPEELEQERRVYPKEKMLKEKDVKEVKESFRTVDVNLNPADFGFTQKSSSTLTQELQTQMQTYKQMIETLTSVMRMLQDMVAKIIQNIR